MKAFANRGKKTAVILIAVIIAFSAIIGIIAGALSQSEPAQAETGAIWSGDAALSFTSGAGTSSNPYIISDGEQLALLSGIVNGTITEINGEAITPSNYNNHAVHYKLGADIVMNITENAAAWSELYQPRNVFTPIGTSSKPFYSNFDGDNHTISGLYVDAKTVDGGLFGFIKNADASVSNSIEIKNINIKDSVFIAANGKATGSIAGTVDSKVIVRSCKSDAKIYGRSEVSAGDLTVGGLVGYLQGSIDGETILGCEFSGVIDVDTAAITSNIKVGGIVGTNAVSASAESYITITNCINKGIITVENEGITKNLKVGGIIGNLNRGGTIGNCGNAGRIRVNPNGTRLRQNNEEPISYGNIGGIIGYSEVEFCDLQQLWNTGDVEAGIISQVYAYNNLGGIIGSFKRKTSNPSFNIGWTMKELYNSGDIISDGVTGGLLGECGDKTTGYPTLLIQNFVNRGRLDGFNHWFWGIICGVQDIDLEVHNIVNFDVARSRDGGTLKDTYLSGGKGAGKDYTDSSSNIFALQINSLEQSLSGEPKINIFQPDGTLYNNVSVGDKRTNDAYTALNLYSETTSGVGQWVKAGKGNNTVFFIPQVFAERFAVAGAAADWGSVTEASQFSKGDGSKANPYIIDSLETFKLFTSRCANSTLSFKLETDIYLNDVSAFETWTKDTPRLNVWNPITELGSDLDGNGHTIYGMFINTGSMNGFAGSIRGRNGDRTVISNLNIAKSYVYSDGDAGGLAAVVNSNVDVVNCSFSGVISNGGFGGDTGGIAGMVFDSAIVDCVVDASIWAARTSKGVGGIVGSLRDAQTVIDGCSFFGQIDNTTQAGGIAGILNFGTIKNCVSYGRMVNAVTAGGICGWVTSVDYSPVDPVLNIINCESADSVSITTASGIHGAAVGGILGVAYNSANERCVNIINCVSSATITLPAGAQTDNGSAYVSLGGIIGDLQQKTVVRDCRTTSDAKIVHGLPNIEVKRSYVGGIIGRLHEGYQHSMPTVHNNFNELSAEFPDKAFNGANDTKDPFLGSIVGFWGGGYLDFKNNVNFKKGYEFLIDSSDSSPSLANAEIVNNYAIFEYENMSWGLFRSTWGADSSNKLFNTSRGILMDQNVAVEYLAFEVSGILAQNIEEALNAHVTEDNTSDGGTLKAFSDREAYWLAEKTGDSISTIKRTETPRYYARYYVQRPDGTEFNEGFFVTEGEKALNRTEFHDNWLYPQDLKSALLDGFTLKGWDNGSGMHNFDTILDRNYVFNAVYEMDTPVISPSANIDVTYDGKNHTIALNADIKHELGTRSWIYLRLKDSEAQKINLDGDGYTFRDVISGYKHTLALNLKHTDKWGKIYKATVTHDFNVTITPAPLTVTGLYAERRQYNLETGVTLKGGELSGIMSNESGVKDDVTAVMPTAGTLADKHAGKNKPVSFTPIVPAGAHVGNYTFTQPVVTAEITTVQISLNGATAVGKVYDGNASVGLSANGFNNVLGTDDVSLDLTTTIAAASDKNVGNAKPVTVTKVGLAGEAARNYECVIPTGLKVNITPKQLKIVGIYPSYQSRIYDGTRNVALSGGSLSGIVSDDVVTCVMPTTGTMPSKNIGTGKPVSVPLPALSGADANNYTVVLADQLFVDIFVKSVTINNFKADDRAYDGTNIVTLSSNGVNGIIDGDKASYSPPVTGTTAMNVGTHPVTIVYGTIAGDDGSNYEIVPPSEVTVNITPKSISIKGITAENRSYNGKKDVAISGANAVLGGVLAQDNISFSLPDIGTIETADAGSGKAVSVTHIGLTSVTNPEICDNYELQSPTDVTVDILPEEITAVWGEKASFVYNGELQAPTATASTGVNGEFAVITVTDAKKDVGANYTATAVLSSVTHGKTENYKLIGNTATFEITARTITVSINTGKEYKENEGPWTNSVWTNRVEGLVTGHVFSGTATTTSSSVGTYESVKGGFIYTDVAVTDADGVNVTANYAIDYDLVVRITNGEIVYTLANYNGVYDNTEHGISLNVETSGHKITYSEDGLAFASTAPTFKDAGEYTVYFRIAADNHDMKDGDAKVIIRPAPLTVTFTKTGGTYTGSAIIPEYTVGGQIGDVDIILAYTGMSNGGVAYSGSDAPSLAGSYTVTATVDNKNFTLAPTSKNYTIERAAASIDTTGVTKAYVYSGVEQRVESGATLNHDETTLEYQNNAFTVVGSGSYTVTIVAKVTFNYLSADTDVVITVEKATLVDASEGYTGIYDGAEHGITASATGFLGSDGINAATIVYGLDENYGYTENITVRKVAESKTVYYKMTFDNYNDITGSKDITITKKTLTITGVTGGSQVYDGQTIVYQITGGKLSGVVTGDIVYPNVPQTGAMADKNAGENKLVTLDGQITLSGTDAADYEITQPEVYVTVTPMLLSVQGLGVVSKVYDGNADMTINVGGAILNAPIQSDKVTVLEAFGTASDANVGRKTVTVNSIVLGSDDKDNYTVSLPIQLKGNITPKTLTFALTADGGTYNGNPFEAQYSDSGYLAGESGTVTLTYKGTTNGGAAIDGTDAPILAGSYSVKATLDNGNYTLGGDVEKTFVIARAQTVINTDDVKKDYVYIGYPQIVNNGATLNHDETAPVYSDNVFTEVGTGSYTVKITAAQTDNYEAAEASVIVTIEKAEYVIEVSFEDAAYIADGTAHSLAVEGRLPEGVSVEYVGNGQTEVGVYVVTAKLSGDAQNYKPIADMTATLTIKASSLTGTGGVEISSEQGFEPNVEIHEGEVAEEVYSGLTLDEKEIAVLYAKDIGLVKDGQPVALNGKVTVRLPIQESLRDRDDLMVVYISDDGQVINMNAVREGDYMVFETDHNSIYAIVSFNLGGLPMGALIGIVAGSILVLLLIVVIIIVIRRKKNRGYGEDGGESGPDDGGNPDESIEETTADNICAEEAEEGSENQAAETGTAVEEPTEEQVENASTEAVTADEISDETEASAEVSDKVAAEAESADKTILTAINENAVVFVPTEQSLEEALQGLSREQRDFYDRLRAYALEKDGAASNMTQNYETVKIGRHNIVKLSVKRSATVAAFSLEHPVLKQYKKQSGEDEGEAIKIKPTEVFVSSVAAFNAAKDMIDIVARQIEIERQEAQQRRKEQRKNKGQKPAADKAE